MSIFWNFDRENPNKHNYFLLLYNINAFKSICCIDRKTVHNNRIIYTSLQNMVDGKLGVFYCTTATKVYVCMGRCSSLTPGLATPRTVVHVRWISGPCSVDSGKRRIPGIRCPTGYDGPRRRVHDTAWA